MSFFSGLGAVLGNSLGQVTSSVTNMLTSKSENRKARSYNYGMWQEENAYNDPSAQMERLKNAGLNPNLVYGNGATTLAARSTPAQPADVRMPQLNILDSVQAYQNIRQNDAQLQNMNAQTDLIRAQTKALRMENIENSDNGTSRATPYLVRLVKSGLNSLIGAYNGINVDGSDVSKASALDRFVDAVDKNFFKYRDIDSVPSAVHYHGKVFRSDNLGKFKGYSSRFSDSFRKVFR